MPIKNRLAEMHAEITGWRRDIHGNPELMYDTHRTSALVAEKVREFGCDEVVEGIRRTGVVGVIKGKTDTWGHVVGLRADMDALPIIEATGLGYASKMPGKMHACGHDGHTAMLLGRTRGTAQCHDQPYCHGLPNGDDAADYLLAQRGSIGVDRRLGHLVPDGKRRLECDPRAG